MKNYKFKPFEAGERIVFIGDSITERNLWISQIVDYYAKNFPKDKIEIYPCGVAGGSCLSAITYYHNQTAIWSPTTAVIMLGMNDIWRENYGVERNERKDRLNQVALSNYKNNLSALSEMLRTVSRVKRIIYLAPTPYDEEQNCETENLIGCQQALRKCADIMRKVSEEFGGEFYDLGGDMWNLIHEVYSVNDKCTIIGNDRVHPNNAGLSVMARLFLSAQGFDEMTPSVKMILNGTSEIPLSPLATDFQNFGMSLQRRWTIEWILARQSPLQTEKEKLEFVKNYPINNPNCGAMFTEWANAYENSVLNEENNKQSLVKTLNDLYQ